MQTTYVHNICISYNTAKSALLDIIICTTPEGECVYIRQSTSAYVITNMLHFQHSKICPNLKLTAPLAYIVTDADCDCGRYFNVFIMFPNVSMTYPIVLFSIMGLYSHQHDLCFKVFIADSVEEFHQLVSNCVFYVHK